MPRTSSDRPGSLGRAALFTLPYLVLLRVGFAEPARSPEPLVSSYLTVSPLPDLEGPAVFSLLHFPSG